MIMSCLLTSGFMDDYTKLNMRIGPMKCQQIKSEAYKGNLNLIQINFLY